MMCKSSDASEQLFGPGEAFYLGPGHNGWVVGDEPCVLFEFEPHAIESYVVDKASCCTKMEA